MSPTDKPLVWLHGEVKSPPLGQMARIEAGYLLRLLQKGHLLTMPQARPMPNIGPQCYELRIRDENSTWRIIYRIDPDAIVIVDVFTKKTARTPKQTIVQSKARLRKYDDCSKE